MKNLHHYLSSFQEVDLSSLLGISPDEYARLHHDPLYQYKNEDGEVTSFFIHIHSFNSREVLDKMNLDEHLIATFQPDDIYDLRRKQLSSTQTKKCNAVMNYKNLETA